MYRVDPEPGAGGKHGNTRHNKTFVYTDDTPEKGDVLYFDGTDWHVLHHGTAGHVLTTGGHAANPAWAVTALPDFYSLPIITNSTVFDSFFCYDWDLDVWHQIGRDNLFNDINHHVLAGLGDDDHTQYVLRSVLTEQGSIAYRNATVWAELLHADTAGKALLSGGHGANPSWGYQDHGVLGGLGDNDHTQYALRSILTEQGSLVYRNATVWAELLHGTAGQCLLSGGHGANPSWGSPDHGGLAGLSDDDHTQYARLNGRSGGQIIYGGTATGDDLNLSSTSFATKGNINFGSLSTYNEVNNRFGIGTLSPAYTLDVAGHALIGGDHSRLLIGSPSFGSNFGVNVHQHFDNSASDVYGLYINNVVENSNTTYRGFRVFVSIDTGAVVTNNYGIQIANPSGAGAITNNYGLYIINQTKGGTRNYAIYAGTGDNYFAGDTGIGVTAPSEKLSVYGAIAILDGMTAPGTTSGYAKIYVDTADGDLKVKFGDGTVKTLATDT
jgi:hypothetical protein